MNRKNTVMFLATVLQAVVSVAQAGSPFGPSKHVPVDLCGPYMAARNSFSGATTDDGGIHVGAAPISQVIDPVNPKGWCHTPFTSVTPPNVLRDVDIRGHNYECKFDLGAHNTWPNPQQVLDFNAGNVSQGSQGSTFVVQVCPSSTGGNPIDLNNFDGQKFSFYHHDGVFDAWFTNLWYNERLPIPQAPDGTQYQLSVDTHGDGSFDVTVTLLNGASANSSFTTHYLGGSAKNGGSARVSFTAELNNNTTDPVAAPTRVVVSEFSTDAIKDATVLYPDKRYGKPGDDFNVDGWLVNLSKDITGYRTSVDRQGTSTSFTSAVFKDGGDFDTLVHDLTPDASHVFTPAKTMSVVANAFSHDENIASWKYHATAAGASLLEILPNYLGVPPRLFDTGFHAFSTRSFNCPKLQVDSVNPTETTVYQVNGVNTAVGAVSAGTLTVNAKALDVDSGIDRFPVCSVKYNNIEGWVDQDMGSSDAKNGIFTTAFPIRPGATAVQVQIKYQDKSGHVPAPVTNTFTIKPGVRCNVSFPSNGVNLPAVQRTIRLVLGGDGGPTDTANPIVVNKTITFTWNANGGNPIFQGNVLLGAGDGVSTSPSNRLKYAYAKDPYHSLGSKVAIGFNGSGEANASFALKGGDFNNDNAVDATDIASYVAQIGNINANTPAIGNSALPVAVANRNCDITGDGKVDNSDLSVLSIYALTSGDNEPGKFGPKLLGASQISSAEALKIGVSAKVIGKIDVNRDGFLTVKEMLAWLRRN